MTAILALAALGTWTYAGFLAQPPPVLPTPPPPSPTIRPIDVAPNVEPPSKPEEEPDDEPESGPPPVIPPPVIPPPVIHPPAAPPSSTANPPTRYRLADARGQVWEHADPVYLRSFVEARDRSYVQTRYYQALPARSARCATGRCN